MRRVVFSSVLLFVCLFAYTFIRLQTKLWASGNPSRCCGLREVPPLSNPVPFRVGLREIGGVLLLSVPFHRISLERGRDGSVRFLCVKRRRLFAPPLLKWKSVKCLRLFSRPIRRRQRSERVFARRNVLCHGYSAQSRFITSFWHEDFLVCTR